MSLFYQKISLILILAFTLSFGFGVATMHMDDNGNMSNCPFMNSAAICQMSFSEHIATFQSTFRVIPSKMVFSAMLVLTFLLVTFSTIIPRIYSPPNNLRLFLKNSLEMPFSSKLLLALSDGIIQPKLYA